MIIYNINEDIFSKCEDLYNKEALTFNPMIKTVSEILRKVSIGCPALVVKDSLHSKSKAIKIHTTKHLTFNMADSVDIFFTIKNKDIMEWVYNNFHSDKELSQYIITLNPEKILDDLSLYVSCFYKDEWYILVPSVLVRIYY